MSENEKTGIREKNILQVMEKTGWTHAYTMAQIKDARKRLGITYKEYNQYKMYDIPIEMQEKEYQKALERKEIRKKEREEIVSSVVEKTGWSREKARQQIMDARERTGCAWKEYLLYRFYELSEEEQEQVFLMELSEKLSLKYDVNQKFKSMLRNKKETNLFFNEYVKRPWCVNKEISFLEFRKKFAKSRRIIYKPLKGNCGHGVETFEINRLKLFMICWKLKKYSKGVVEEYVVQHPSMSALSPFAVNTMRVVTMSSNSFAVTNSGEKMDVAYVALRIGGADAVVDNFHSGGMVASVDKNTGEVVTDAVDMEGNVYKVHPETEKTIRGFKVPLFQESLAMVTEAIEKNQIEGYLGWDIAITENGPVLIEVNTMPAVALLSAPYVPEKKGMKDLMEKYL